MKLLGLIIALSILFFSASCTGYSKYPLCEKGEVKVDEKMFGIWKAVEDTSSKNFIAIQAADDLHANVDEIRQIYGSVKRYGEYMDSLVGHDTKKDTIFLIKEITDLKNKYLKDKDYLYWVTYFNMHGRNPLYQQWNMNICKIGSTSFINSRYRNHFKQEGGHIIFKILMATSDSLVVCIVSDPSMKELKSSEEVRKKIEQNLNNKAFYSDTTHFYKVKGGHFGLRKAVSLANK